MIWPGSDSPNLDWPLREITPMLNVTGEFREGCKLLRIALFDDQVVRGLATRLLAFKGFVQIICSMKGLPRGRWKLHRRKKDTWFGWTCEYTIRFTEIDPGPRFNAGHLVAIMRDLGRALYSCTQATPKA